MLPMSLIGMTQLMVWGTRAHTEGSTSKQALP